MAYEPVHDLTSSAAGNAGQGQIDQARREGMDDGECCRSTANNGSGHQALPHQHIGVDDRKGDGEAIRERHGAGLSSSM